MELPQVASAPQEGDHKRKAVEQGKGTLVQNLVRIAWGLFPFLDQRLKSCHRNYLTCLFVETVSDGPEVFWPRRLFA